MNNLITRENFDAVLFDLDGVLTATARVHAICWKKMFDDFLKRYSTERMEDFLAFDLNKDYSLYVDGKPRYDGVQSFLESRGIQLPKGGPDASPDENTICGLGNLKNEIFNDILRTSGAEVYEDSVALVKQLRTQGIQTAVVSSSKNSEVILRTAGILELFVLRLDGEIASRLKLRGKPAPDTFLEAARQLGTEPSRVAVVEDAISGVQAAQAGGFKLVIGVDRKNDPESLRKNGADVVVTDLRELLRLV